MGQQQCHEKTKEEMLEEAAEAVEEAANADYAEAVSGLKDEFEELINYAGEHPDRILLLTIKMVKGSMSDEQYLNDVNEKMLIILDLFKNVDNFRLAICLDNGLVIVAGLQSFVAFSPQKDGTYSVKATPSKAMAMSEGLLVSLSSSVGDTPHFVGPVSSTAIQNGRKYDLMTYSCDLQKCSTIDLIPK